MSSTLILSTLSWANSFSFFKSRLKCLVSAPFTLETCSYNPRYSLAQSPWPPWHLARLQFCTCVSFECSSAVPSALPGCYLCWESLLLSSTRKNTFPEGRLRRHAGYASADKSLHPTTASLFPSLAPEAPHGVGLQSRTSPLSTESVASPPYKAPPSPPPLSPTLATLGILCFPAAVEAAMAAAELVR